MNMSDPTLTIYEFSVSEGTGYEVTMQKYKGQVVLIVNVATNCSFADNNFKQMKELLEKYHKKGFRIATFPSNQFGHEPGGTEEVKEIMQKKYNFNPDVYQKVDVNGSSEDPLFTFLKKQQGGTLIDAIKWNFTKFLVNRRGQVVSRYAPTSEPKSMVTEIEKLLADKH